MVVSPASYARLRFFDAEDFMLSMIKPNAMLKDLIWTGRCPE
tara:strand:+ start:516 stop:641 length:126 start_codon:yes stop_codon:yes gene_type:complete